MRIKDKWSDDSWSGVDQVILIFLSEEAMDMFGEEGSTVRFLCELT